MIECIFISQNRGMRLDEKATCSVYLIEIRLPRIVKDESKDYITQT